jgi:hypothetical protein
MENAKTVLKEDARSDVTDISYRGEIKKNDEWIQEYEVIYNSYVLEK